MKKLSLFIILILSTISAFSAQKSSQMNVSLVITGNSCETTQISNIKGTIINSSCLSPVAIVDNNIQQDQATLFLKAEDKTNHQITIMY